MKRNILILILISISVYLFAQEGNRGDFQIGLQGGLSAPLGNYKTVGDSKIGFYSALFVDKYLIGNKFGLGIEARYIQNGQNIKSREFANGSFMAEYFGKKNFQDYLFAFGPIYKLSKGLSQLEFFIKGGVLIQTFPTYNYKASYLMETATVPPEDFSIRYTINDESNKANSWVALGGLRYNFLLSNAFSIFAQLDYTQAFGDKFGGKMSFYQTEELRERTDNLLGTTSELINAIDNFDGFKIRKGAHYQSFNAGLGVKYVFGKHEPKPKSEPVVVKPISRTKNLQVVVRDEQTKLFLSGVNVSVSGEGIYESSLSNENGQTVKVMALEPGNYTVMGEKNGIKTPIITLTADDFNTNSTVIVKELFHDDPRFTLAGETFDCNLERNAPNISTLLVNTTNDKEVSEVSNERGKFEYQLEINSDYVLSANERERYSQTEHVSTKGLKRSQTLYVTLKLGVCYLIKDGVWALNNILYEYNNDELNKDARFILDNVARVMRENSSLKIELASHTDSRGNAKYNMKLSQQRANKAVDYLVSKGISRSRLVAKGYGETRLLNRCSKGVNCSEEEHHQNRRTEVKILEYQR